MSSKSSHRIKKIQSLANRGDWKKAYKEAAFLLKQAPDPEVRRLLVSSLWGWIKDSVRKNQFEEAKSNITELLRQSDIPQEIQMEFPPIFRTLGLNSLLPKEMQQDMSDPKIQTELIDRFLLLGTKSDDISPENLADAERILTAFHKIETKNDAEALELIKSISFRSPLAEWRLFLRGLVDHYRNNNEKAAESWRRLVPERPPIRIATKLRDLLQDETNTASSTNSTEKKQGAVSRIFGMLRGQSDSDSSRKTELLDTLRIIDDYLKQKKYKELVGRFHSSKKLFQETMPIQFDRLIRIIALELLLYAPPAIVRQFVDRNIPLPLDPRGNRTFAMLSDHIENEEKFERPNWLLAPTTYWKSFADKDIDLIDSFSQKMKNRAKAAVYDFLASRMAQEYFEVHAEFDEYEIEQLFEVPRSLNDVDKLLEKAISCDPTYAKSYEHKRKFYLMSLSRKELGQIYYSHIVEIDKRLLEHIPNDKESLQYVCEYYMMNKDPDSAKPYYEKLCQIDPLSRETQFRRSRFAFLRMRKGLRERKFKKVDAAIRDFDAAPPLETVLYRFDLIPLALKYLNDFLQEKDGKEKKTEEKVKKGRKKETEKKEDLLEKYFTAAKRIGITKKAPLILTILAEIEELDLPIKDLKAFESELEETLSGRCNGNTAGTLGDLANNFRLSASISRKIRNLLKKIYDYVNRSGQVKWNSEKDLFGACYLLWALAVDNHRKEYEKTFQNLVKKGVKQYPQSLFFKFFKAELFQFEDSWERMRSRETTLKEYQDFLRSVGVARNDPEYLAFVQIAELRINELSYMSPFPFSFGPADYDDDDDDYDDDDWDEDDDDWDDDDEADNQGGAPGDFSGLFGSSNKLPEGIEFPPELQNKIRKEGGFAPALRKELEEKLGISAKVLSDLFLDSMEECILKGIPPEQYKAIAMAKVGKMTKAEQLIFLASFFQSCPTSAQDGTTDEDDNEDNSGFFPGFAPENDKKNTDKNKKKNKKKKR